ncbi:MAG: hypothetical protein HN348_33640 [Proteobacteria bacterium]|nr:hypothetical protein [Pseudomonadota bacterium]
MSKFIAVALLTLSLPSWAKQTHFAVDRGPQRRSFEVEWTDSADKEQKVSYKIDDESIERHLTANLRFNKRDAHLAAAEAVRSWAAKQDVGVTITANAALGRVRIRARGTSQNAVNTALRHAAIIRDQALADNSYDQGFTRLNNGKYIPDHARFARSYADDLQPVAEALSQPGLSKREYASRALAFVQSIPYERRFLVQDTGYRRPLSVLAKNKGDCDSKSTLYLALLRQGRPNLDTAIVYVPGHAFVALGLPVQQGDTTVRASGRTWVVAEPVGPAVEPIGSLGSRSQRGSRRGSQELRVVTR